MIIKYPPRKPYFTHSPNCSCDRCWHYKYVKKRENTKIDYFGYIVSPLWEERRIKYFKKHKYQCQSCGVLRDIQLHHMEYGNFGNEPDYALAALCLVCHNEFHKKHGTEKNMIKASLLFIKDKQKGIQHIIKTMNSIDNKI